MRVSDSFARPSNTTAYASGDLAANSATAGSVAPLEFGDAGTAARRIRLVTLHKTSATTSGASFRLWLLSESPTVTNGDNGVIAGNWSGSVLAIFEGSTAYAATDGASVFMTPVGEAPTLSGKLYGLLEVRGSYTPVADEVFTVTLEELPARFA